MRILLVNPPRIKQNMPTLRDEICFQDVIYTPFPIRLAQTAGVIIKKFPSAKIQIIDANAMNYDLRKLEDEMPQADILIFQSAAGIIREDSQVATIAKKKNKNIKTIIIESVVAPIYPQRFLNDFPDIDIIIQGQPERIIPDIIENIDNLSVVHGIAYRDCDSVKVNPESDLIADMDSIPYMAYDLFPMEKYSVSMIDAPMHEKVIPGICIRTTRDCPYGCPFCIIGSSPARGYDGKWRAMSVKRVVDEIEHAINEWGVWGFFFWDETFTLDKKRAFEICREIIDRKLRLEWRCLTRFDCIDKNLLEIMHKAGCRQIEFGLEAGDPQSRKQLHKNFPDELAISIVKQARKIGIRVNVDMIVGMPWETKQTLDKTLKLAKKLNADNVHLTMAFPYPGTKFYDIAEKENLLQIDDIYDLMINQRIRIGAKPVVKTRNLSDADIENGWKKIRSSINRYYLLRKVFLEPASFAKLFISCRNPEEFFVLLKKGIKRFFRILMFKTS